MTSTRFRHKVVLLLLAILLALPWTASAGSRLENTPAVALSAFLDDLLSRVRSFLTGGGSNKEGCYIDPNGHCATSPEPQPTTQTETGCYIDPNGRCAPRAPEPQPTIQTDTGCYIDPDGRCRF